MLFSDENADMSPSVACFFTLLLVSSDECFLGGTRGKESTCSVGDTDSSPGSGRRPRKGDGREIPRIEEPSGQSMGVAKSLSNIVLEVYITATKFKAWR